MKLRDHHIGKESFLSWEFGTSPVARLPTNILFLSSGATAVVSIFYLSIWMLSTSLSCSLWCYQHLLPVPRDVINIFYLFLIRFSTSFPCTLWCYQHILPVPCKVINIFYLSPYKMVNIFYLAVPLRGGQHLMPAPL